MKKATKAVVKFVYKVIGLCYVVDEVRSFVFQYRLRLRIVPVSYKLFVLTLGVLIGGSGVFVRLEYSNFITPEKWTFENPAINTVQAKEVETVKVDEVEKMADYIWMKESTRGKNNYSKCEEVGKVNGVGYAIPGDGSYVCFDSHEEEMQVLKGWIVYRKALGWSELKMLCTYSGNNYDECKK